MGHKPKTPNWFNSAPTKKYFLPECRGCSYWRGMSSTQVKSVCCCHYMLDTGKRRQMENGKCISRLNSTGEAAKEWKDPTS